MKKTVILPIPRDIFLAMLNGSASMNWPNDSKVLNIRMAWELDCVELLVQSESFDEVPDNVASPYCYPLIQRSEDGLVIMIEREKVSA